MSKKLIYNYEVEGALTKAIVRQRLTDKYFSLFMNDIEIEEMEAQEQYFFLKRMWGVGTIASYKTPVQVIFTDYTPIEYNIYDFPTKVNLINRKNVRFIPIAPQTLGKDNSKVSLVWAQKNHKPIVSMVLYYINKIASVEMVIKLNLNSHKTPFIIGTSAEAKERMKEFFNQLDNDEEKLYMEYNEAGDITIFNGNPNYIIDKLKAYELQIENELKEYLGFSNMGTFEKKEHLINSEIEANNEITEASGDSILDSINEGLEEMNKLYGTHFKAKRKRDHKNEEIEEEK